jgi:excisionase family DNA binding protein
MQDEYEIEDDAAFLHSDDVVEYLQISLRTLYRLIKQGEIPAVRVGHAWRFRREHVEAWVRSRTMARRTYHGACDRPRVLVVDDEEPVLHLMVKTLALADYDVDTAPDGPTALQMLDDGRYDLLITDLKMPGMDGLSVIREARRRTAGIPIVILTGHSTEASAIEAINLGVSGYLLKPFRVPRILSVTARALGHAPPPMTSAAAGPA